MASVESSLFHPGLCANNDSSGSPCLNSASNVCSRCHLVQYCSNECQAGHWKKHKTDCQSPLLKADWKPRWHHERRPPSPGNHIGGRGRCAWGGAEYLWGNMPAIDMLNLSDEKNEDDHRDFSLLFAASGDLRNFIKTALGLPKIYQGRCDAVINDVNINVVARNAILLLIAMKYEPETAVPYIIHLWYSASIPAAMLKSLQDNILPMIENVCKKIESKPAASMQAKNWTFEDRPGSLRLVLLKEQWLRLHDYFTLPNGITFEKAQQIRKAVTLAPSRSDFRETWLHNQGRPDVRLCVSKFQEDGMLLPFGSSRKPFDTPNPTFLRPNQENTLNVFGMWPLLDDADPRQGWDYREYSKYVPAAKHDLYGSLFFYIRDIFLQFCQRTKSINVNAKLFCVNAKDLPGLVQGATFDRIEVSNITDPGNLGFEKTVTLLSPLLKTKSDNPKAVLLALFQSAVGEAATAMPDTMDALHAKIQKMKPYLQPPQNTSGNNYHADWIKVQMAAARIVPYDKLFADFMRKSDMRGITKNCGLWMRDQDQHSIVKAWPWRIDPGVTTKEDFNYLCWNFTTCERYVEWERAT